MMPASDDLDARVTELHKRLYEANSKLMAARPTTKLEQKIVRCLMRYAPEDVNTLNVLSSDPDNTVAIFNAIAYVETCATMMNTAREVFDGFEPPTHPPQGQIN